MNKLSVTILAWVRMVARVSHKSLEKVINFGYVALFRWSSFKWTKTLCKLFLVLSCWARCASFNRDDALTRDHAWVCWCCWSSLLSASKPEKVQFLCYIFSLLHLLINTYQNLTSSFCLTFQVLQIFIKVTNSGALVMQTML